MRKVPINETRRRKKHTRKGQGPVSSPGILTRGTYNTAGQGWKKEDRAIIAMEHQAPGSSRCCRNCRTRYYVRTCPVLASKEQQQRHLE